MISISIPMTLRSCYTFSVSSETDLLPFSLLAPWVVLRKTKIPFWTKQQQQQCLLSSSSSTSPPTNQPTTHIITLSEFTSTTATYYYYYYSNHCYKVQLYQKKNTPTTSNLSFVPTTHETHHEHHSSDTVFILVLQNV